MEEDKSQKTDMMKKSRVNVDMVMLTEIGEFGLYQFRLILLGALVAIFAAWSANNFLFTAGRIETRCYIPECEDLSDATFLPAWVVNAIPEVGNSIDNCRRFEPTNASTFYEYNVCPKDLFDRESVIPCDDFIYENTNTVVYDYGLACNEWARSLIGTLRTSGTLFSLLISGYISDRFGRRTCMVINMTITATIGTLRVFAGTYIGFVISQFFEGFGFGALSCAYIMSMEIVGTKYRVAAAATISSCFATGQVTLAAIAWAVPYWKHLTLILYLPQFLVITYLWIMPENARWHLSKGRFEEAEKVLKEAARVNKRQLSEENRQALRQVAEENKSKEISQEKEPWLITLVFRNKPILVRCIASPIWWISTMCVYYGLTINAVHMVGNMYLNFMLVAAVEIPGYWLAVLLMNKVGRRPTLVGGFWVCAICMIAYVFISEDTYWLSLTLYLIGKCSISTVMVSIHLYTAELYPTKYRHSLFAFSSMMGRFGHIVAPLTPAFSQELWEELPFVIFAVLALVSGSLVFLTPETLGVSLPDTMEQAVNIDKRKEDSNIKA